MILTLVLSFQASLAVCHDSDTNWQADPELLTCAKAIFVRKVSDNIRITAKFVGNRESPTKSIIVS